MLFISRTPSDSSSLSDFDRKDFGVVDTDDWSETMCSVRDIVDAISVYGLHIEGVRTRVASDGQYIIESITVYQHEDFCTSIQTKLKVMSGVDLRLYKDEIVFLVADGSSTFGSVSLRLSVYGKRMSWNIPLGWFNHLYDRVLELVVDDTFEIYGDKPNVNIEGVRWDIRQVTNRDFAAKFYKPFRYAGMFDITGFRLFVIDNLERELYFSHNVDKL